MSNSQIEEWKEADLNTNYNTKQLMFNRDTEECYLAGILLIEYYDDINPNKIKNFFDKISYYGRVFLAYKLLVL